jgi:hypothetical protein
MTTFLMGVLAFLVLAFLTMLAVQMIRVEKMVVDMTDTTDAKVSKMFGETEGR